MSSRNNFYLYFFFNNSPFLQRDITSDLEGWLGETTPSSPKASSTLWRGTGRVKVRGRGEEGKGRRGEGEGGREGGREGGSEEGEYPGKAGFVAS